MTRIKMQKFFDNLSPELKENVGCNEQPRFEDLSHVMVMCSHLIKDVQFPCYDTLFIRFNAQVEPIVMAALISRLHSDETRQADISCLNYVDGTVSPECKKNITKYVRFWWD